MLYRVICNFSPLSGSRNFKS